MANASHQTLEITLEDDDGPFSYPIDQIEKILIHPTYRLSGGVVHCSGKAVKVDHLTLLRTISDLSIPVERTTGMFEWLESNPDDPPIEFFARWLRSLAELTSEGLTNGTLNAASIARFYQNLDAQYLEGRTTLKES